jgi:hypothetical protein
VKLAFAVAAAVVLGGCIKYPSSSSSSGLNAFDGTYNYSYQLNYAGTEQYYNNAAQFIVSNGQISSNPSGFSGSVTDTFGDVSFQGPCPVGNTGGATFTGILDNGNPKFGQGTWTCNNGGASDHWSVNNGQ